MFPESKHDHGKPSLTEPTVVNSVEQAKCQTTNSTKLIRPDTQASVPLPTYPVETESKEREKERGKGKGKVIGPVQEGVDTVMQDMPFQNPRKQGAKKRSSLPQGKEILLKDEPRTVSYTLLGMLQRWSTENMRLDKLRRFALSSAVVLALNDYACRSGATVKARHACDIPGNGQTGGLGGAVDRQNVIFIACKEWTNLEKDTYMGGSPQERFTASGILYGWLWQQPTTHVLKIQVLYASPRRVGRDGIEEAVIKVVGENMQDARLKNRDVVVLIWMNSRLFCTSMIDILNSPMLDSEGKIKTLRQDSVPVISMTRYRPTQGHGYVSIRWIYMTGSHACRKWAETAQIGEDEPEQMLCELLETTLLGLADREDAGLCVARKWGDEYDRLIYDGL